LHQEKHTDVPVPSQCHVRSQLSVPSNTELFTYDLFWRYLWQLCSFNLHDEGRKEVILIIGKI
jgi:hypothetical protein